MLVDKRSRVLLEIILIIIIASSVVTFYKFVILKDFEVINTGEEIEILQETQAEY